MRLDLLLTGSQVLTAQALAPSTKIKPTRWALGDAVDFDYSYTMNNAQGNIFATGDKTKMVYVPIGDGVCGNIICKLTPDDPTGVVGNLVLFVAFNNVEYPFLMMRQHTSVRDVKLQRTVHKVGTELNLNLSLSIPGLTNRFDFSELTIERPSWLILDTEFDIPASFLDERDQAFISNFGGTGKPAVIFSVGNEFYGYGPSMIHQVRDGVHVNDPNTFTVSGGVSGDGYV